MFIIECISAAVVKLSFIIISIRYSGYSCQTVFLIIVSIGYISFAYCRGVRLSLRNIGAVAVSIQRKDIIGDDIGAGLVINRSQAIGIVIVICCFSAVEIL